MQRGPSFLLGGICRNVVRVLRLAERRINPRDATRPASVGLSLMTSFKGVAVEVRPSAVRGQERRSRSAVLLSASSLLALAFAREAVAQTAAPALPQGGAFVAGSGTIVTAGA